MAQRTSSIDSVIPATLDDEPRYSASVPVHPGVTGPRDAVTTIDPVAGRLPDGLHRHDEDIERTAMQLLDWAAAVPKGAVVVAVENQVITLTGTVTWTFQSDAATRAVSDVRGVRDVRNAVTVDRPASAPGILGSSLRKGVGGHLT